MPRAPLRHRAGCPGGAPAGAGDKDKNIFSKVNIAGGLAFSLAASWLSWTAAATGPENEIMKFLNQKCADSAKMARTLWEYAEPEVTDTVVYIVVIPVAANLFEWLTLLDPAASTLSQGPADAL